MDSETGERLRDMETGETPAVARLNLETGEVEINCVQPQCASRRTFKIPNSYIWKPPASKTVGAGEPRSSGKGIKMTPIILFLLPTVVFVPAVAIVLGIVEIVLHIWAHKKNKRLKNKDVYYQSPLHIILSEFCACCVDESMKTKIGKMQDRRTDKVFARNSAEYFRRVVT